MNLVLESCRNHRRVFVDLWNLEEFSSSPLCFHLRFKRREIMNLTHRRPCPGHLPDLR
jgi:hypothetical protein